MDVSIARAFLYRMLNPEQREKLNAFEMGLPPGRYLQGFEICKLFRLKVETLKNQELAEMIAVKDQFEAMLWKKRIIEYKAENPNLTGEELKDTVSSTIGWEDMNEWQNYALEHYQKPGGNFKGFPAVTFEYVKP